jgi:glycosyltransferase involved in cell wall biosynthesis
MKKIFFSIVIPTLNEEKYLPFLLKDLSLQTYNNFEVVHIDGNSDDKTINYANKFKKTLNIRSNNVKIRNVGFQRNEGVKLANGQWVVFMDADNRLNQNFLQELKNNISKNHNLNLFTTLTSIKENIILEKWANFWLLIHNNFKKKAAYGAMIGVKKDLALKYPFDRKQKIMEDVIFVQKIVDAGYKFVILKKPRYSVSLRRIKSKGFFKNAKSMIKVAYSYYIKGNDFRENDFGHKMDGDYSN